MRPRAATGAAVLLLSALAAGCGGDAPRMRVLAKFPPVVTCATRSGPAVWVGSWAGLTRIEDGKAVLFAEDAGFPKGVQVRSIFVKGGILWLATSAGVIEFSAATGRVVRTWKPAQGLGSDSVRWAGEVAGRMWAGTIFGASRLEAGSRRWKTYKVADGLSQDHVYAMAEAGKTAWASCINGGLARFDAGRGKWTAIPQDHGLGNKHIYAILPAGDALWLGTAAGLNLYHTAEGRWDAAVCDDGFTDYCVRSLALDGRVLWFGTSYGLHRRDLDTGRQDVFTRADGLPDDEVTSITADGKGLLVTTREGVVEVTPR